MCFVQLHIASRYADIWKFQRASSPNLLVLSPAFYRSHIHPSVGSPIFFPNALDERKKQSELTSPLVFGVHVYEI